MAFIPPMVAAVSSFAASNAATIAAVGAVMGGGISAYSAHQQGQAAKKQSKYQAAAVRSNAMQQKFDSATNMQTSKVQADSAMREGAEARRRSLVKTRRSAAQFLANSARRGITLGAVSLSDSLKAFTTQANSEASDIGYSTALKARSSRHQQRGFMASGDRALTLGRTQSNLLIASGQNQARSGSLSAIGYGVSGVTSALGHLG